MFKNKLTILFFVVIIIPIFIYFLFNNYFWKKTQIQSKNIFSENQNEDIEKNLNLCAELNDEQDQLTCIKKITEQNIAIGDCDQIPLRFFDLEDKKNIGDIELRNVCKSEVIYKKAVSDNNVFLCESIISNAIKIKCFGKLGNIPLNSDYDTDGDGYGDGDEVKKMYSPIGGGGLFKLN